ncbi:hypothetical protein ACQEU5_25095 [Marinactinospora thermotolerans]|uniref:hypothetical protein n=1 Tax=Marinactinospora thermotolerans TaxID=531310 RepID=UPI003D92E6DA
MEEYELVVALDGITLDDDAADRLADALDAVLSWRRGICWMRAAGVGATPEEAVAAVEARARTVAPGLRLVGVEVVGGA